jgi:putative toxin-antitoxin system antitoxin component (TIGR02293 family)
MPRPGFQRRSRFATTGLLSAKWLDFLDILSKAVYHEPMIRPANPHWKARQEITAVINRVRTGFPYKAVLDFHKTSGLPLATIAHIIRIPQRTLNRRKAEGKLAPDESERLLRLSTLFDHAVALFEGDVAAARHWLTTPKKALAGQTPLDFADTEIGARQVEDLIGRLEHGVFT